MQYLIADTFTDSLARLTGDEQKAAKTSAFDLQMDPSRPGLRFHRVDRARDRNFWSVRVSSDIRIIVHRTQKSLLLCYVDHHDDAYLWAQRRRLETHPRTGAAQLVEVRETVKEIEVPVYVQVEKPRPLPFANITDDELLNYGVPAEWLPDVRTADDNTLLDLADHLPVEAAEALLELATGGTPPLPSHASPETGSYAFAVAPSRYSTGGLSQVPIPPPPETGSDTDWEAPLGFSTGGLPQIPSHTPPQTDPFEHPGRPPPLPRHTRRRRVGNAPSTTRGRSGWSSCIRPSGNWSSGPTTGLPAYQARPAPAKPSSRSTVPSIWRAPIPMPAFC